MLGVNDIRPNSGKSSVIMTCVFVHFYSFHYVDFKYIVSDIKYSLCETYLCYCIICSTFLGQDVTNICTQLSSSFDINCQTTANKQTNKQWYIQHRESSVVLIKTMISFHLFLYDLLMKHIETADLATSTESIILILVIW